MEEDRCENCWWGYGIGGSCCNPHYIDKLDEEIVKPCGWFEPKEETKEIDEYEIYQNTWN